MIPKPLLGCSRRPPALDTEISATERVLGLTLPPDYKAFLRETNGLKGFVTQEAYLILWAVSDLPSLNESYGVSEFLTGVTLIGTDGGDTGTDSGSAKI
jgi:SMI1 / KNR4 family (SUKH-1)